MKDFTKKYIIASDFDGVIWDSVDECFYVGLQVYKNYGNLSGGEDFLLERFRQGRFLVRTGEDFYLIFHLLQENPGVDFDEVSTEEFYSLRVKMRRDILAFAGDFYRERERMHTEEAEKWHSFQGPFPGIMEQLPVLKENFADFVICSAKDDASIRKSLDLYGQSYNLYGREYSLHKADQIRHLSADSETPPERIIFIDDLLENLQAVKAAGANVFMTYWGYNNEGERQKAARAGIPLLYRDDIYGQLAKFCRENEGK